jgi:hypothetical protein
VVVATAVKTSLIRISSWTRRFASFPADPSREGSQLSNAAPKEATFSTLKRFQVVPPTLPRSVLQAIAPTLGLKATFPNCAPPKQTANPRSWMTRAAVESLVTRESPFGGCAEGSPCCASVNTFQ